MGILVHRVGVLLSEAAEGAKGSRWELYLVDILIARFRAMIIEGENLGIDPSAVETATIQTKSAQRETKRSAVKVEFCKLS